MTLSTEEEVLRDVVNEDTVAKIRSNKKDRMGQSIFYITSQLCIEEGNSDLQLWERYRPSLKVIHNKMNIKTISLNSGQFTLLNLVETWHRFVGYLFYRCIRKLALVDIS